MLVRELNLGLFHFSFARLVLMFCVGVKEFVSIELVSTGCLFN